MTDAISTLKMEMQYATEGDFKLKQLAKNFGRASSSEVLRELQIRSHLRQ